MVRNTDLASSDSQLMLESTHADAQAIVTKASASPLHPEVRSGPLYCVPIGVVELALVGYLGPLHRGVHRDPDFLAEGFGYQGHVPCVARCHVCGCWSRDAQGSPDTNCHVVEEVSSHVADILQVFGVGFAVDADGVHCRDLFPNY